VETNRPHGQIRNFAHVFIVLPWLDSIIPTAATLSNGSDVVDDDLAVRCKEECGALHKREYA